MAGGSNSLGGIRGSRAAPPPLPVAQVVVQTAPPAPSDEARGYYSRALSVLTCTFLIGAGVAVGIWSAR